ncbi:MAG: hypothetical protein HY744_23640, partial [Deltaproteobacteria bacterium]|nr:hypothetical protein [Deltaproteobacteria bacterium]
EEQGSWEEEQAQQIDELLAYVDEKAGTTPAIIMGDMNTGPAGASFVGEVPANYAKFVKAGLHSPYVERAAAQCTFCQTNPLVAGAADDSQSVVIDHVLLRSFAGVAMAERVLDQPIQVETCGKPIAAAYSDHYGVMVSLSWPSE